MTNAEIVAMNMVMLINEGKMTIDEDIHTFQGWKSRGYSVKKGEKCIAKFPIWKYTVKEKDGEEEAHTFMKNSCWFSTSQVERREATT